MKTYYVSIDDIHQATLQLQHTPCPHCHRDQHLLSHGYIYKKQTAGKPPIVVGKRVFCSNRRQHQGCGRTRPLYLAACVRFMHYAGTALWTFITLLMSGIGVEAAYLKATGALDARQAWRWMDKLMANLSWLRAALPAPESVSLPHFPKRRRLIAETFLALRTRLGANLVVAFQSQLQRLLLWPAPRFTAL